MARSTDEPEPENFPRQPRWATWIRGRNPQFKPHSHLGLAKNALSGRPLRRAHGRHARLNGKKIYEYQLEGGYVYEWVVDDLGEGWVERFHIEAGTYKSEHPLWKSSESERPVRPPSQAAIDKAIASIQESG